MVEFKNMGVKELILYENIFGLFDYEEYSFPNGVFYSKIDKEKEIEISSYNVVVLDETVFQLNNNWLCSEKVLIKN